MIKLSKILFMFVALLGLSANSFAADVTMRISIQLPMKSHLGQNLLLFKNDVEKNQTEKLKFKFMIQLNCIKIRKYLQQLVQVQLKQV